MINSTQSGLDVELQSNNKLYKKEITENRHSEVILQQVDDLIRSASILPKDMDYVAICVGPGSFTGIRVAISVAKAFAVVTKCRIVIFNTFELYSYNVLDADICVVNGFSNFYYVRIGTDMDCIEKEDLQEKIKGVRVVCDKVVAEKLNVAKYIEPNKEMWLLVKDKIDKGEVTPVEDVDALYLRMSQAEMTRLGKNGKV